MVAMTLHQWIKANKPEGAECRKNFVWFWSDGELVCNIYLTKDAVAIQNVHPYIKVGSPYMAILQTAIDFAQRIEGQRLSRL